MSILVPFLAESPALYPAEIAALRDALALFIHQLLFNTRKLTLEQAYTMKPLAKVHKRLLSLARAAAAHPTKARKLRLEFDELLALRRLNGQIQAAGGYELHLLGALGKVHQKAINLDQHIDTECL